MFQPRELRDELQVLKLDVADLLGKAGAGIADASSSQVEALAEQIKAVLSDLGDTVGREEDRIREIISD